MFLKIFLISSLLFLFSCAEIVTTTNEKKATGIGYGTSRDDAVNNAIIEALGQITGVKISKTAIKETLSIKNQDGKKLDMTYNGEIKKVTKGKVDAYQILNVMEKENGQFVAEVEVVNTEITKKYKTPGLNASNRRSIVVVPANFKDENFNIINEVKSSRDININLSQELLNSITQTRKFNVLDREESRAFYNEQNIFRSEDTNKDEAIKLGNVLGADYLLLTSIKDINIRKKAVNNYIASTNDSYEVSTTIQFKVITTSTRQVKFSNTRTYNFEPSGNSNKEIYYNSLNEISNKIATELIENIYPITVIAINDNEIILNQGNMVVGSKYEVYKLGEKIIDNYTKESLGKTEIKVGVIEIIRALPKISMAKILEGTTEERNIVRTFYSSEKNQLEYQKIGKESDTQIKKGGGVVLPFD